MFDIFVFIIIWKLLIAKAGFYIEVIKRHHAVSLLINVVHSVDHIDTKINPLDVKVYISHAIRGFLQGQ